MSSGLKLYTALSLMFGAGVAMTVMLNENYRVYTLMILFIGWVAFYANETLGGNYDRKHRVRHNKNNAC